MESRNTFTDYIMSVAETKHIPFEPDDIHGSLTALLADRGLARRFFDKGQTDWSFVIDHADELPAIRSQTGPLPDDREHISALLENLNHDLEQRPDWNNFWETAKEQVGENQNKLRDLEFFREHLLMSYRFAASGYLYGQQSTSIPNITKDMDKEEQAKILSARNQIKEAQDRIQLSNGLLLDERLAALNGTSISESINKRLTDTLSSYPKLKTFFAAVDQPEQKLQDFLEDKPDNIISMWLAIGNNKDSPERKDFYEKLATINNQALKNINIIHPDLATLLNKYRPFAEKSVVAEQLLTKKYGALNPQEQQDFCIALLITQPHILHGYEKQLTQQSTEDLKYLLGTLSQERKLYANFANYHVVTDNIMLTLERQEARHQNVAGVDNYAKNREKKMKDQKHDTGRTKKFGIKFGAKGEEKVKLAGRFSEAYRSNQTQTFFSALSRKEKKILLKGELGGEVKKILGEKEFNEQLQNAKRFGRKK